MKRAVVIDDEPGAVRYYRQALELHGWEIDSFTTTSEVRDWLGRIGHEVSPPDAVVLDLMMPPGDLFDMVKTKNGLETGLCLFEMLRDSMPDLPVLILSSYHDKVGELQKSYQDYKFVKIASKYEAPPFTVVKILDELVSARESIAADP